jgi:hypothetical protein
MVGLRGVDCTVLPKSFLGAICITSLGTTKVYSLRVYRFSNVNSECHLFKELVLEYFCMTVVLDIDSKNRVVLLGTTSIIAIRRSTTVTKDRASYMELYTSFLSYGKHG